MTAGRGGKQYALSPFGPEGLENRIFGGPYGVLREQFAQEGVALDTYDQVDLAAVDEVIFFNYNEDVYRACIAAGLERSALTLCAFEPPVVMPLQYTAETWDKFGHVFTWLDDRVDNETVFKLRYPQAPPPVPDERAFAERKFLVLINANKYSYAPNELYSYRRAAIRHFERRDDFDLLGFSWDQRTLDRRAIGEAFAYRRPATLLRDLLDSFRRYKSYRGSVENKYAAMTNYKFALCFENELNAPGYITEKLFDCFVCGTIPVYLGAPNVTDYVPSECFIDMREYERFTDLERFLEAVSEEQFESMQRAGREFLASDRFREWEPPAVFRAIVSQLA